AEELQRSEQRQQQHGLGLDDDVPAEDDVLHLERPRREEIGRPLEPEAADAERREDQRSTRKRCTAASSSVSPSPGVDGATSSPFSTRGIAVRMAAER